jgi:predicted GNAT superfamily acetyltransferase
MSMIIRRLETAEDYEACENTMKEIWQFDERDTIPHHLLRPINDQGGLVLGAFENEKMIGILVGFLGYYKGILHHHSHVTGVLQQYKGVGFNLKQKQREFALSQGLDLITWTFDPLQSPNAYFNFAKLGVISNIYYEDYYGEMRDSLNKGLSSDRLLVEWQITTNDVIQRVEGTFQQPRLDKISQADTVNKTEKVQKFRKTVSFDIDLDSKKLLIEIPSDINTMKSKALNLAQEWRETTRKIFQHYFSKGYTAYNVLSEVKGKERRTYYLLRKDSHENSTD